MSELDVAGSQPVITGSAGGSAGRLMRQAREAKGLPVDALAASIKVSVRKLELLEADRFDELPDATFTRALAQTVCRSLKLDAGPVLALLPAARGYRIEQVSEGLNAPFRDRSSRLDSLAFGALLKVAWAPMLILLLAGLLWFAPSGMLTNMLASAGTLMRSVRLPTMSGADPAASAPDATSAEAAPAGETGLGQTPVDTVSAPVPTRDPPARVPARPGAGPLQLRATAESWVEVKDARDRVLMSRSLQPGEAVTLDGVLPMRIKIGNAAATEVRLRGELVDTAPMTSENIARVELK